MYSPFAIMPLAIVIFFNTLRLRSQFSHLLYDVVRSVAAVDSTVINGVHDDNDLHIGSREEQ